MSKRLNAQVDAEPAYTILHCMRAPVGGLFRHVLDLATGQAAHGHRVGIIADGSASNSLTTARLKAVEPNLTLGITLMPMGRQPGLGDAATTWRLIEHAQPLKPHILHGHGAKGGAYARLAAQALKVRGEKVAAIYTPHGGSLNFRPDTVAGVGVLAMEKLLRAATDGLVFESEFAARVYRERVGAGDVPVRVIPNGLQPQDFGFHEPQPDAADFVFIGELRDLKGVDVMIEALGALNPTRRVSAAIVGSGPFERELKAQVRSLGLHDLVIFHGPMPAREAFNLGRVLVVPSRAESFPYIVLEAGAAAVPMLASNVGGIPEIVAGIDIPLLPPGDAGALAQAMIDVLTAPYAASLRAVRLKAAVGEKFTVRSMTSSVLDFYGQALAASSPLPMIRDQIA